VTLTTFMPREPEFIVATNGLVIGIAVEIQYE